MWPWPRFNIIWLGLMKIERGYMKPIIILGIALFIAGLGTPGPGFVLCGVGVVLILYGLNL